MSEIGLDYLTLDRPAATLSAGELKRVALTKTLGSGLVNTLYVLDEPTTGLHPSETGRLIAVLHRLRDQGNTLVVVEHDHDVDPGRGPRRRSRPRRRRGRRPGALQRSARGLLQGSSIGDQRLPERPPSRADPGLAAPDRPRDPSSLTARAATT